MTGFGRSAAATLVTIVERVLVRPVVHGHLRTRGPRGYTTMVVLGTAGIVVALAVVLLAPVLRDRWVLVPTQVGLEAPAEPLGLLVALLVLAIALMHTAALHAPWWGKIAGLGMAAGYLSLIGGQSYQTDAPAVALTSVAVAMLGLIVLQVWRWRHRSAWWELPVVLGIYGVATATALLPVLRGATGSGAGRGLETVSIILSDLATFATPVILVASLSVAQVGLRAATWTVRGVRVLVPLWVALVVCVLVLGTRAVIDVTGWLDTVEFSGTRIAGAAALLAASALVWGLVRWLGRRFHRSTIAVLSGDLTTWALPLALVMSLPTVVLWSAYNLWHLPSTLATLRGEAGPGAGVIDIALAVSDWLTSPTAAVLVAGALLVVAAALAVRGWDGPAGFVAVLAVVHGTSVIWGLETPLYYLPLLLTAIGVVALVAVAVTQRIDARRIEALTLLGLLTTLLQFREIFDQPLGLLLGATVGVAASMVWAFLTGGSATTEPAGRRSRAAWLLGYSLLGFVVLAFAALAANLDATFNPEAVSQRGDMLFGTAVLLTAIVATLGAIVRDDDLGEIG